MVDGVRWSAPRPGRFTPGKEIRYPLYRRLGGPQSRSGRVRKISPQQGFHSRIVQPVASCYTDWAILAHSSARKRHFYLCFFWGDYPAFRMKVQRYSVLAMLLTFKIPRKVRVFLAVRHDWPYFVLKTRHTFLLAEFAGIISRKWHFFSLPNILGCKTASIIRIHIYIIDIQRSFLSSAFS